MKKKIMMIVVVMNIIGILAGCSGKVECDFCGEEKKCTTKTVWGEEVNYCRDCEEEINEMFE